MRSNNSNITSAPTISTDECAEQLAYDQLDPRIRAFIQSAPEKLSAIWALKMQRQYGVESLLESGRKMIAQRYPGYKPI